VESVLAFGGASGLAIGLATQDLVKNFMGGLMLATRRPFAAGDKVKTGASARSTRSSIAPFAAAHQPTRGGTAPCPTAAHQLKSPAADSAHPTCAALQKQREWKGLLICTDTQSSGILHSGKSAKQCLDSLPTAPNSLASH